MKERVHTSKLHMYQLSDNLNSFFGLISTYSLSKLPNLNKADLVYTFISYH